jgi:hypothetical protein
MKGATVDELWKLLAGGSATIAAGAVGSHLRVRERVARLEAQVEAVGEKVDHTNAAAERLEEAARGQALQADRIAIQVESILDTLSRRAMPGQPGGRRNDLL